MSFSSTRMSTSSASGRTATVTVEVWMRPLDSVCGTRWTRCTPRSNLSRLQAPRPWMNSTISLKPPTPVGWLSITSTFHFWRSEYFVYIRARSAAKSPASSPPAPARISTKTFLSSLGSFGRISARSSSSSLPWRAASSSTSACAISRISRSASSAAMWRASSRRPRSCLYSSNFWTTSESSEAALAVLA